MKCAPATASRLTGFKTMHDGQYEEYSYDCRYRLWLSQVVDSGTSVLHETEYVFNAASEVESTYIDSDQTDYVYDDASQLEQEVPTCVAERSF